MKRLLVNAMLFNVGWLACVLSSRFGAPLAALAVVLPIAVVHLLWTMEASRRRAEILSIVVVATSGVAVDAANLALDVLRFQDSNQITATYLLWMSAFWINFAMLLNVALRWLARMPIVAAVLGAISAPGTYAGGAALGALALGESATRALTAIAIEWLIVLPALSLIARRLNPPVAAPPRGATMPADSAPAGRSGP